MTQEDKELLLKDLCARLPYGVKCKITTIKKEEIETLSPEQVGVFKRNNCKIYPYLRPMLSMTDEERRVLDSMCNGVEMVSRLSGLKMFDKAFDWLNAHHFDYRNLIESGLALKAPEGMYN